MYLRRKYDFSSLTLEDLLEARDNYHVHLANLDHVVGTAVGKYLIREEDPDAKNPDKEHPRPVADIRTLSNTVIKPWSWPAVIVFVNQWATPHELDKRPEEFVPLRLYLPDGRVIPVCVVYAPETPGPPSPVVDLQFPGGLIGGGYPVFSEVQGQKHVGSIGCLVSDGHSVYALTNRHVAGPPGQESYSILDGEKQLLGKSDEKSINAIPFAKAYSGWPGQKAISHLDAGLIRLGDVSLWTSQVYGIGEMGPLLDANVSNIDINLISLPVKAYGSVSGQLTGEVKALFYRFKTVGGVDYVADYLIGPRDGDRTIPTRPGDSGTIWFWDVAADELLQKKNTSGPHNQGNEDQADIQRERLPPLAIQWGGQSILEESSQASMEFALATNLSNVLRELNVELYRDWGLGQREYWGKVGHYKLGAKACDLVASKKLYTLMQSNIDRIALSDQAISDNSLPMNNQEEFIALADIPDLRWRSIRPKDAANHFATLDKPSKDEGKTLLDMWREDRDTLNVDTWVDFYDRLDIKSVKQQGALPFRVWQIYDEMVEAARKQQVTRFVAAAGILAHYVADACQPLHISWMHHGVHEGEENVHSLYETSMIDRYRIEMMAGINKILDNQEVIGSYRGGRQAANAVMQLMNYTLHVLPPSDVIEAYNKHSGRERIPYMWQVVGDRTIDCMAEGVVYLAEMWENAWQEGNGNRISGSKLGSVSKAALRNLYMNKNFLESRWLRDMSDLIP